LVESEDSMERHSTIRVTQTAPQM